MSNDEFPKPRQVLGDVTNCPAKRGFSLISSDLGITSSSVHGKNIDNEDADLHIVKHRRLGVENVFANKCRQSDDENDMPLPIPKGKEPCGLLHPYTSIISSQESITSAMPNMPNEIQEKCGLLEDNNNSANDIAATQSLLIIDEASRDSSVSTVSIPTYSELYNGVADSQDEGRVPLDVIQSIGKSSCEDLGVGKLGSSNFGSVDWLKLPKSQGSKGFSLKRCSQDNMEGCANFNDDDTALKACTCSFCLKAAYIWSDLHYQDIKGRIAALKKSRKEASLLVQSSSRGNDADVQCDGNSNTSSSKLESDLTGQWKSLFLHMEEILIRESNQLQAGSVTLKELREKCKTDLEMINAMPSDKQ